MHMDIKSEAGDLPESDSMSLTDAAVAVAAALNMTEPASTGIGGDMFCLFFDATNKDVHALNGSGRSAMNTSLEQIRDQLGDGIEDAGKLPFESALSVTVPGAAAGWVDAVERFGSGKVGLEEILMPAIELGEKGFPVSEISAQFWGAGEQQLRQASPNFREMLKRDDSQEHHVRAPRAGEIMRNPTLAQTFRTLASEGKKGFYTGRVAKAIVDVVQLRGGHLHLSDLERHLRLGTETTTPISFKFRGQKTARMSNAAKVSGDSENDFVELWEHPPNGQGIVALMALGILEELEVMREIPSFTADDHNSISYLHAVIESLKIAFADGHWWVTDPDHSRFKPDEMVSRPYLSSRAKLFKQNIAQDQSHGQPGVSPAHNHSDTVYFCVTDGFGNGMSFINSNYEGFGSGIIPEGCGFTLQNRGANFQIGPAGHPNIYEPGKRPYHTIIPGMITQNDLNSKCQLHSVFGVMGGFMQPQGHLQVLLNMEVFGMNPQQALDAPRICISANSQDGGKSMHGPTIFAEYGIDNNVIAGLRAMGHHVEVLRDSKRSKFGRGQIIRRYVDDGTGLIVWAGGSDPRGDGCAMPA
ncbi:Glutathione hydrolase-like YwrD proenzyme [Colletotrichum siamense]|nr:Glutathione hydrolase-like YwrD proenzyme [Colletotrichum siamense]